MEIVNRVAELRDRIAKARSEGKTIGFVPTMGALHEGHLSLMRAARAENGFAVVSIFVNPMQFGPNEDYATYPRDLSADVRKCEEVGIDLVFAPDVEEMYAPDFHTHVDVDTVANILEGVMRPGHFRGVATVVLKLFNQVQPDKAYFGHKDYQQLLVIRKMVRDLDVNVEVIGMPTVREPDGLAMSSRNAYLSPEERRAAVVLYQALEKARELAASGLRDGTKLRSEIEEFISNEPLAQIDYVAVANPYTLEPVADIQGSVLVALAVRIGSTRLIDNTLISV